ncbi:STAS domain-containing protein [Eubacterium xylanophilum]|uniref:STAS domain-containing protein n=1 Tax=Eubacterium xylanophilum TaxID=39497 RepID=UPI00047BF9EE|nr:STAS domain-containing protein [Eubacterium xylanophilum]
MKVDKIKDGSKLTLAVSERLDTSTAPELETIILDSIEGITDLVIDFKDLVYISSAGLRVLLSTQKKMNKQGKMVIKNVNDDVMEVFEITGFTDILTFE